MNISRRARRLFIAIPVMAVVGFILYWGLNVAAYGYLTVSFNRLRTGMSHAEVHRVLWGFRESSISLRRLGRFRNISGCHDMSIVQYNLPGAPGLDSSIVVAYDKRNRLAYKGDLFE